MRPAEVTDEDIIQAGRQLIASGVPQKDITGNRIRQITGRGNPYRLGSVWHKHVAAEVGGEKEVVELPRAFKDALNAASSEMIAMFERLTSELYQEAVAKADGRVQEAIEAAHQKQSRAEQQLEEISEAFDVLESQLTEERVESEAKDKALDELQDVVKAHQIENARITQQLVDKRGRIQAMSEEVEQLRRDRLQMSALQGKIELLEKQHTELISKHHVSRPIITPPHKRPGAGRATTP